MQLRGWRGGFESADDLLLYLGTLRGCELPLAISLDPTAY
jgi:hypothetical protein